MSSSASFRRARRIRLQADRMKVTVFDSGGAVAFALAERVASTLRAKPDAVLGLASGRTPVDGYAEMQRLHAAGEMDWARASTFNLDERSEERRVGEECRSRGS